MQLERIRATIVTALEDANVAAQLERARIEAFAAGAQDLPFSELGLDSLARMELLVALEMEHGAAVLPSEFSRLRSLDELARHVAACAARPQVVDAPMAGSGHVLDAQSTMLARIPRLFRRAVVHCRTVAQMHLLLSLLSGRMTPLEAAAFRRAQQAGDALPHDAPARFADELEDWFRGFESTLRGAGKSEPEPYEGLRLAPAVTHFSGPGERANKTLLVCFAGKGGRSMGIGLAPLLQHLDARRYDVLLIADMWATAFRGGVPLLGADVHAVVRWVEKLELLREYAGLRAAGASAGVYPALLTGPRIGAELIVGFNGRFPSERHLGTLISMYFHCTRALRRRDRGRVLLVHAANTRRDAAFARRLSRVTGSSRLAVEMSGRELKHNVMPPLLEHGELGWFLARTLLAPLDSEWLAAPRAANSVRFPLEHSARS